MKRKNLPEKKERTTKTATDTKVNRGVETTVNPIRARSLHESQVDTNGPVVYWMSRDQRSKDNWALLKAQELAKHNKGLVVVFNMVPSFLGATSRQYKFMVEGLKNVEENLKLKQIPMFLLVDDTSPARAICSFVKKYDISHVVCDYSPLKISRVWKNELVEALQEETLNCSLTEVDAHNIVPVWETSTKQEYAARTIRPKINKKLPTFLTDFPEVKQNSLPHAWMKKQYEKGIDWSQAMEIVEKQMTVPDTDWIHPGEDAAQLALEKFCTERFKNYSTARNNPTRDAQSNLSPYLHFGNLSAQRAALVAEKQRKPFPESVDGFLEELIIRRELSDNFCHYNPNYDSFDGFPDWAQKTLTAHRKDKREYTYTLEQFQNYKTHDPLWNAAQIELVYRGKLHGYMRMYWAKKILEWSSSPEEALRIAIFLNDTYELDGRDPNGYVGCAWSIGGVHDQGWKERPVFGKVRFMNEQGCKKKFDVDMYIDRCTRLIPITIEDKRLQKEIVSTKKKNDK